MVVCLYINWLTVESKPRVCSVPDRVSVPQSVYRDMLAVLGDVFPTALFVL